MKYLEHNKLILIGASTGGPAHIEKIIASLEENFEATIVIAQHMGEEFIPSFVKRLKTKSSHSIELAQEGMLLNKRSIYITSYNTKIISKHSLHFEVTQTPKSFYNPNINTLFHSGADLTKQNEILAIILTGIGDDGVDGLDALYKAGALCIAESQESAIVFGMPARAIEKIPNIQVASLANIITKIREFTR